MTIQEFRRRSVPQASGCIEFQGAKTIGYGSVRWGGRSRLAHRIAWQLAHGPIPTGMYICHHCDNPPCVNVDHLFIGTHTDNLHDSSVKGRMHPGERHGMAKWTEDQIREIKARLRSGERASDIAIAAGIPVTTIYAIKNGWTWRHVA